MGSGGGGSAGIGGAGGAAGTGDGARLPCASRWQPNPSEPDRMTLCTYEFPSNGVATRVCDNLAGMVTEFQYDVTLPCGFPCNTGRPREVEVGNHFDATMLPWTQMRTVMSGNQVSRVEYLFDNDGNEIQARTYDENDQLSFTTTTTYGPLVPVQISDTETAQTRAFSTMLQGFEINEGDLQFDENGQLSRHDSIIGEEIEDAARFLYTYNPDGTLDRVNWQVAGPEDPGEFIFAYEPTTTTVTLESPEGMVTSVLTFDYECGT